LLHRWWIALCGGAALAACSDAPASSSSSALDDAADIGGDVGDGSGDGDADGSTDDGSGADADTGSGDSDTDGDGLLDGEEDANGNGIVDPGETDPRVADSDGDGISDGDEVAAGYDPTSNDSDGDGLLDGEEDRDGDGIVSSCDDTPPLIDADSDGVLDVCESSPLNPDTDGDGTPDNEESLQQACAFTRWPDVELHAIPGTELTQLATGPGESWITTTSPFVGRVDASTFRAGVVALNESWATLDAATLAVISRASSGLRILQRESATFTRADVTLQQTVLLLQPPARQDVGRLRDDIMARVAGDRATLPASAAAATTTNRVRVTFALRQLPDSTWLVSLTVADATAEPDATPGEHEFAAHGSVLPTASTTVPDRTCYPQAIDLIRPATDYLWVVDDTPSMVDDRETIAAASDEFFSLLEEAGADFRIAVVSTQMLNDEWWLVEPGFSNVLQDFQSQLRSPPRQSGPPGSEFSLRTLLNVLTLSRSPFAPAQVRWRTGSTRSVVFLTDEDDQTLKDSSGNVACDPATNPSLEGCDVVDDAVESLGVDSIRAFAIVGDPPDGCSAPAPATTTADAGSAYAALAQRTGGAWASICSDDLGDTVTRLVEQSFAARGSLVLRGVPLTPTLTVVRNGTVVPRDAANGWTWDAFTNSLVFRGTASLELGDDVAIGYQQLVQP
jgi:hypothetical protein